MVTPVTPVTLGHWVVIDTRVTGVTSALIVQTDNVVTNLLARGETALLCRAT